MASNDFWSWYLRNFKQVCCVGSLSCFLNRLEFTFGVLFVVIGSGIVVQYLSPYWLFIIIPIGITLIAHGYWRGTIKGGN